ncbi:L-glutaminase [Herbihabitans rhizosphaerae]|uniref:Glutaminase n=1 Tax=Herbihabitans rhizosphaerae TaxID=1872711 RepID=A0A4Q7KIC2_9PSEU|nr:L-glutaminase [Herbihabitans rhizosphaerae]
MVQDDAVVDQSLLERIHDEVRPLIGTGRVADYIPALAAVNARGFGLAVASADGEVFGVGDYRVPFSVQSLSKVFAFGLALSLETGRIWDRVGHEPSNHAFNSLLQLERDRGVPRNPFVNAGALVTVDQLLSRTGDAVGALRAFVRAEAANPDIDVDKAVATSERDNCHRNAALAHLIASYGNLDNDIDAVLDHYVAQCALAMSCRDLALAGRFLVRHGVRAGGGRLLSAADTKRLNATMFVCGMYDGVGEFAYRVGLPAKSGVGGGIVAVVPGRYVICVWSPGLDASGNSVAGVAALEALSAATGWSAF